MARIRLPGGELEYAILAALWDLGRASARDVHMVVALALVLSSLAAASILGMKAGDPLVAALLNALA